MPESRTVACPTCGKNAPWNPENKWRPFCSERCKVIDLGAWASEQYRVPVTEDPEQIEEPDAGEPPERSGR